MTTPATRSLEHLPVSAFGAVMGIAGTSMAWGWAHRVLDAPRPVSTVLAWLALAVFAGTTLAYALKARRFPGAVAAEWVHPVKMVFAPTITIGVLVMSVGFADIHAGFAAALWWAGALGQAAITINTVRIWVARSTFELAHVHPAWFIPAVGNLVVPLAGVSHAGAEVNWFFFGVGMVYWLTLLPLVLARLVIKAPMPPRLSPTLAILMSPPAVGVLAWVRLGGAWDDPFARVLLGVAVFQAIVLLAQFAQWRRAPFALSAWAYTFPMAALTAALLAASAATASGLYHWLGVLSLTVLSTVVLGVSVRSAVAIRRGEFLTAEPAPAPSLAAV